MIPTNIVMGNNLYYITDTTLTYDASNGAIAYGMEDGQTGSVFVGIDPFVNGNLTFRLKVLSDDFHSNVYILGSTFWIQTQTMPDGQARVASLYRTTSGALTEQYYDVPASLLDDGVNTIHVMVSGTTKVLKIYFNEDYSITTPMSDLSVQNLPYDPITMPLVRFDNEVGTGATWVSTLIYGIKETVNGNVVSAMPGNEYVPFGIDYPRIQANLNGTNYMASSNQKGVAWVDVGWLTYQPYQVEYTQTLLNAGWELGIHFNTTLTTLTTQAALDLMQEQYDYVTELFGQAPTSWCSLQNKDNVTHAIFAYNQLGMIWRNGNSGVNYIANIGNLMETRWSEFWSYISAAGIVYPCMTHTTDALEAELYSISYDSFTTWVDNYAAKNIIGFNEYNHRIWNQVDTKISYQTYEKDKSLVFSIECNNYDSRLVIGFKANNHLVVLKNGSPLVNNTDYYVSNGQIVLFGQNGATYTIKNYEAPNAPQYLQAVAGIGYVDLNWTSPSYDGGDEIAHYAIYRGTTPGTEFLLATVGNVTSYRDSSVTDKVTYYYHVSAINSIGESLPSMEASATPLALEFTYRYINENSEVEIISYFGDGGHIVVPSTINDKPVTSIGSNAFKGNVKITSATLPNTLTSIGGLAFYKCSSLTSITLPESLISIGDRAFTYCSKLASINIPNNVTLIDNYAFYECTSLKAVTIGSGVTSLGNYAFYKCSSLTSITIPQSVTSIGSYTFYGCSSLTSINMPDYVTSIGDHAFTYCSKLTSVTISEGATSIGGLAFYKCSSLTSITLPESLISIGDRAFTYCSKLASINIPNNVTLIDNYAFYECTSLKAVTIGSGVTSLGNYAFYKCSSLTSITIPQSVTSIGSYTFYGCSSLTSIALPDGVKVIKDHLFTSCTSLTSATIPNNVTSIGSYAFYGCTNLGSINIPGKVTTIGERVFTYCTSLTTVTMPDSIRTMGSYTFYGCTELTDVAISKSLTSISSYTFYGCTKLYAVTIPYKVTAIGDQAFRGCSALSSVTLSGNVTSIGSYAFYGCTNLGSVTMRSSVTSLGTYAFYQCSSLTAMYFEGDAPSCGSGWISKHNPNLIIYYYEGAEGFTNPWQGVPTVMLVTPATVPSAPQSLIAIPGDSQVSLNWNAPSSDGGSPITNYTIYRDGLALATVGNVTEYTDITVVNGVPYIYNITAINAAGESVRSNLAEATPLAPATVPSTPLSPGAIPGDNRVTLNWTAPASNGGSTITNYTIYRDDVAIATVGDVLEYVDDLVVNGQTYIYQITAINEVGESVRSDSVEATPITPATRPSAPQNLTALPADSQVSLNWNAPSSDGGSPITNYTIYRNGVEIDRIGNVLVYIDTMAVNGVPYAYNVTAINAIGESLESNTAEATPLATIDVPSVPQNLTAVPGDNQVALNWTAPESNGGSAITNYTIYRNGLVLATVGNFLEYVDISAINGQTYLYQITAINEVGESVRSDSVEATPMAPATVPSAPRNPGVVIGDSQVMVNWTAPVSDGGSAISNYTIYRNGTAIDTVGNVLEYIDTTVVNGETYFYEISATNAVGEGAKSSTVEASITSP